jgi:hypothetical protein
MFKRYQALTMLEGRINVGLWHTLEISLQIENDKIKFLSQARGDDWGLYKRLEDPLLKTSMFKL